MATRSFIAIKTKENTYKGIYCHWDGYPENNGKILVNDYSKLEKVEELIELGHISSLHDNIEKTRNDSYHISHNEEKEIFSFTEEREIFEKASDMHCEYVYIFKEDETLKPHEAYFWHCYDVYNEFGEINLSEFLN